MNTMENNKEKPTYIYEWKWYDGSLMGFLRMKCKE
jgi:hypothetical protein